MAKVTVLFRMVTAGDMSANITSLGFNVQSMDNIGLEYVFTGTAATGTWVFVGSNDSVDGTSGSGTWFTVTPDGTLPTNPSGSSGANFGVAFTNYPYKWLQVRYTRTSGSGTLNVIALGKEI